MTQSRSRLQKFALAVFIAGAAPFAVGVILQRLGVISEHANLIGLGLLLVIGVLIAAVLGIVDGFTRKSRTRLLHDPRGSTTVHTTQGQSKNDSLRQKT